MTRPHVIVILLIAIGSFRHALAESPQITEEAASVDNFRRPTSDSDLRAWLENMVLYHHFTHQEVQWATGLTTSEIESAIQRFQLADQKRPTRTPTEPLTTLPYPGGRHPRIGFLDGALRPQRETKVSVFTPWDPSSYVVIDVPEAIWSNLGLTYLAHTHIPTLWAQQGLELPEQEWQRIDGTFRMQRRLPNGIEFGTIVKPHSNHVQMEMWLRNGSQNRLSDLRVQNCVMLRGAKGFDQQTNDNKHVREPYVCCKSVDSRRWVIAAWEPVDRAWANAPCPCLHSDPKFPDCEPGETKRLRGWLSFYDGSAIDEELNRIDGLDWKSTPYLEPTLNNPEMAKFVIESKPDRWNVSLNGQNFGSYLFAHDELTRPAWIGIHSLSGVPVTRDFPATGDDVDHRLMHPGIWISFGHLNGQDYWRMNARTRHERFLAGPTVDGNHASFVVLNSYLSADGKATMCRETTRYSLSARKDGVLLRIESSFENPDADFYFGDQEESGLAFRMAPELSVDGGTGTILNHLGDENGREVWGKQTKWVDYTGTAHGRHVGILVRPHANNARECWMHARDYGVVACNPFPRQPAERREPYVKTWVKRGKVYRLGYDVLIHDTNEEFDPADLE